MREVLPLLVFTVIIPLQMHFLLSIAISILSFGAVADNEKANNAPMINQAITACAERGGGKVIVPEGTFTTGTIYLKDNVMLVLEKGSVLKGSTDLADYSSLHTSLDLSRYESGEGTANFNSATDPQWSKALIFATGVHHAGIEGDGCIDGNNIRNPFGEERMRGPHTILLTGCRDMIFRDFTTSNSANYAFLAYQTKNISFRNLKINGGWDGIHIRGGENIDISHCQLHTGDDAIAGGYWRDALIQDCIINSSCNGIRMIMPSRNVKIEDCSFEGPGIHPHHTSGRTETETAINIQPGGWGKAPGRLDNIRISRCRMNNLLCPVSVTLSDDNSAGTIIIDDLQAKNIKHMALSVKSWGKAVIDKVVIRRSHIEFVGKDDPALPQWFEGKPFSEWPVFPCWGIYFRNVKKIDTDKVTLTLRGNDYRQPVIFDGSELRGDGFHVTRDGSE